MNTRNLIPTLPQRQAQAAEKARRLILLVDDDELILGVLGAFLQQAGYDVKFAASGETALQMLAESGRRPDLALLDVSMPGMSGLELGGRLQRENTVPVMYLSADNDQATIRLATDSGAVGYLVKPIDAVQIMPAIQAGLARADEIRHLRSKEMRLTASLAQARETGMAVGVLMERLKTDRETAFKVLRDHARASRRKIGDVAAGVLSSSETLNLFALRRCELSTPE